MEELELHFAQTQLSVDRIRDKNEYLKLNTKIWFLSFNRAVRKENRSEYLKQMLAEEIKVAETNFDQSPTHFAQLHLLSTQSNYNYLLNNFDLYYEYSKKCLQLYEQQLGLSALPFRRYFSMINNYLNACYLSERLDELTSQLAKYKKTKLLKSVVPLSSFIIFQSLGVLELSLNLKKGIFEKNLELKKTFDKKFELYGNMMSQKYASLFEFAYALSYYGIGKRTDALLHVNNFIDFDKKNVRSGLLNATMMMKLIIHFELNNRQLLGYLIQNTKNFLKKQKESCKVEFLIVQTISKSQKLINHKEQSDLFEQIVPTLKSFQKDKYESFAFEYFNYHIWIEGFINNRTYSEQTKLSFSKKT